MPELIGGLSSLQERIQYPESAKQAGKEGRVYVQFIVNEEGEVENPRIMRGIGGGADEAALERSEERRVGKEGRSRWVRAQGNGKMVSEDRRYRTKRRLTI